MRFASTSVELPNLMVLGAPCWCSSSSPTLGSVRGVHYGVVRKGRGKAHWTAEAAHIAGTAYGASRLTWLEAQASWPVVQSPCGHARGAGPCMWSDKGCCIV